MKRRGKGKEGKAIGLETIILIFHFCFFNFKLRFTTFDIMKFAKL